MKTNLIKPFLSVIAVGIAIGGAFTTHAMENNNKAVASRDGYQLVGTACTFKNTCSDITSTLMCTVGNVDNAPQLWGLHPITGQCNVPLYRP